MRTVMPIVCLFIFGLEVSALDTIQKVINFAKTAQGLFDVGSHSQNSERNFSNSRIRTINTQNNNFNGYVSKVSQLKANGRRDDFIPSMIIKNNKISLNGATTISRNKLKVSSTGVFFAFANEDVIYIYSTGGKLIRAIKSEGHVKQITFVGNDILYTYDDPNGNVQAIIAYAGNQRQNQFGQSRRLFVNNNFIASGDNVSVKILAHNDQYCLLEHHVGDVYTLFKINVSNGIATKLSETDHKLICLFDSELRVRLTIKPSQTEGSFDVYWINISNGKSVLVDQFSKYSNHRRYLSADNQGNIYFQTASSNGGLQIYALNSVKGGQSSNQVRESLVYQLSNVPDASQCDVYINNQGKPYMVTAHVKGPFNSAISGADMKSIISFLNSKCSPRKWALETTSDNGDIWIIKTVSDTIPPVFYAVNTKNKSIWEIGKQVINVHQNNLQSMKYFMCPNTQNCQMFLTSAKITKGANNNVPMIVIFDHRGKFRWGYSALDQLLASRGYNVLRVNFKDEDSARIQMNVWNSICWAINNNLCNQGNIVLCAEKKGAIHAVELFMQHREFFKCLTLTGQNASLIQQLREYLQGMPWNGASPDNMFIMGNFSNIDIEGDWSETFGDQSIALSINTLMVDKMKMALLVDGFNKMFFGEISENTLTRKELNEIDILYDGPGWFDNNLINKIPASNRESDMSSVIYQNI